MYYYNISGENRQRHRPIGDNDLIVENITRDEDLQPNSSNEFVAADTDFSTNYRYKLIQVRLRFISYRSIIHNPAFS